ncbi:MAG: PCC domain-containing protein [Chloroflexota bacterium]
MSELEGVRYGTCTFGRVIAVRLAPGADILRSIEDVVKAEGVRAGVILSGVARVRRESVRRALSLLPGAFPAGDPRQSYLLGDEPLELISVCGNIAEHDGEPVLNVHFLAAADRRGGAAIGGQLVEGCQVEETGEIVIAEVAGLAMVRRSEPGVRQAELFFGLD